VDGGTTGWWWTAVAAVSSSCRLTQLPPAPNHLRLRRVVIRAGTFDMQQPNLALREQTSFMTKFGRVDMVILAPASLAVPWLKIKKGSTFEDTDNNE
jgi:hypothetical protein